LLFFCNHLSVSVTYDFIVEFLFCFSKIPF
jgi:hypothetical protein